MISLIRRLLHRPLNDSNFSILKALNEQLSGNKAQARSLFEEIAQEDERLYFVQMARHWLANNGEGILKYSEQELERIETLTADLPSLELGKPKKNKKKMVMASLDYSSPNAAGNYSNNH